MPPNVIPFKCHLQTSHYCVNDLKYTIIPCKPSAISMDCLTVVGWARVVTLWSGVGPWGRIACLAHNVIGSDPGECDCCAEPPPGTVVLLFRPVDTLNAVREPRQTREPFYQEALCYPAAPLLPQPNTGEQSWHFTQEHFDPCKFSTTWCVASQTFPKWYNYIYI